MRDDLDPDLAALYAKERAAPLPDGATTRILAGVIGHVTAAPAAAAAAGFTTGKVVAIALASAIGGGTIGVVAYRGLAAPPVAVHAPAPAPARELPPDAAPPPVDAGVSELDAASAIDAPPMRPRPDAHVDEKVVDDTREPLLIDRARAALRRGLVDEALATLMRHERVHPNGDLAEERDVLIIEAYAAQNNPTLAKRRIERYRREHPSGFLRARVDRAETTLAP
jgi:hypothetical protein